MKRRHAFQATTEVRAPVLRRLVLTVCLGAILVPSGASLSRTWHVPAESPTIFGAVDSASYGDTVLVAPGTYCRERDKDVGYGNIHWIEMRDGVTLISEGGASTVTLVETGSGPYNYAISCDSIEGARIAGFTIAVGTCLRGGEGWDTAILLRASDVTVADNIISHFWYGIDISGDVGVMRKPAIQGNEIVDCLFAITVEGSPRADSPLLEGNSIREGNTGIMVRDSDPYIRGNTISGFDEAGVNFIGWSESVMESNRIVNNGNYGVYARMDDWLYSPCLNCVRGVETANDVYGNGLYDVYYVENTGFGLFEATLNYWGTPCPQPGRFHGRVRWTPWVDSTHTILCSDCDSCGDATEPTTWGSIKAMFR